MKPTIVTFAGSARRDSLNKMLARSAARAADSLGARGVFVDLADYELPLYHGDLEASEGVPANGVVLAGLIQDADGLFIASPEYNGAYSALLKNTIDWVSRVDRRIFVRPVALGSASPGGMGGARGLRVLRASLENMHVPVIDAQLTVPTAHEVLGEYELADLESREMLKSVIAALIERTHAFAA